MIEEANFPLDVVKDKRKHKKHKEKKSKKDKKSKKVFKCALCIFQITNDRIRNPKSAEDIVAQVAVAAALIVTVMLRETL